MSVYPAVFAIEGEIVHCGDCKEALYVLAYDLVQDCTVIESRVFRPVTEDVPGVIDGQVSECPVCGTDWFPGWYVRLNRGDFKAVRVLRAA